MKVFSITSVILVSFSKRMHNQSQWFNTKQNGVSSSDVPPMSDTNSCNVSFRHSWPDNLSSLCSCIVMRCFKLCGELVNVKDKGKSTLPADFVKINYIFHRAKFSTKDGFEVPSQTSVKNSWGVSLYRSHSHSTTLEHLCPPSPSPLSTEQTLRGTKKSLRSSEIVKRIRHATSAADPVKLRTQNTKTLMFLTLYSTKILP